MSEIFQISHKLCDLVIYVLNVMPTSMCPCCVCYMVRFGYQYFRFEKCNFFYGRFFINFITERKREIKTVAPNCNPDEVFFLWEAETHLMVYTFDRSYIIKGKYSSFFLIV